MGKAYFSDEFKRDALRQIAERGHPVAEVAHRLWVGAPSLYEWKRKHATPVGKGDQQAEESRRLKRDGTDPLEGSSGLDRLCRVFVCVEGGGRKPLLLHQAD